MLTQAGLSIASLIPQLIGARELGRTRPIMRNAKRAHKALDRGFDQHVADIANGKEVGFTVNYSTPKGDTAWEGFKEARVNPNKFASSTVAGVDPQININPNADRAYFAHEMGHVAAQQTEFGNFVNRLRQNPKLAKAAGISLLGLPVVAAALESGDDDLDSSIALAALSSAPVLADEALATYHGQRIMDKAGLRTSLGQRGKLAGGLLSYMALPVLAGVGGNMLGNVIDQNE